MDDDQLAAAWESFATALHEVPERRKERLRRRPSTLADLGQSKRDYDAQRYQMLAMQASTRYHEYRGINPGIFGFGITL